MADPNRRRWPALLLAFLFFGIAACLAQVVLGPPGACLVLLILMGTLAAIKSSVDWVVDAIEDGRENS